MIELQDLKDYLGVTDDAEDDRLEELERNAVAYIQEQTDRYFGPPAETTEWLFLPSNGTAFGYGMPTRRRRQSLWLSEPPLMNPVDTDAYATVAEYAYPGAAATDPALVEATDYAVRFAGIPGTPGYSGYLARLGSAYDWHRAPYEYEVTYWRGYDAGEEPGGIRQLVLALVSAKRANVGREGLRSETIGTDYSYTRFNEGDVSGLPGANETIRAWRRLVVQ